MQLNQFKCWIEIVDFWLVHSSWATLIYAHITIYNDEIDNYIYLHAVAKMGFGNVIFWYGRLENTFLWYLGSRKCHVCLVWESRKCHIVVCIFSVSEVLVMPLLYGESQKCHFLVKGLPIKFVKLYPLLILNGVALK